MKIKKSKKETQDERTFSNVSPLIPTPPSNLPDEFLKVLKATKQSEKVAPASDPEPTTVNDNEAVDETEAMISPKKRKRIIVFIAAAVLSAALLIGVFCAIMFFVNSKEHPADSLFDEVGLLGIKSVDNGLWGFINKDGEVVIDYQFLDVRPFTKNGFAAVKANNGGKWGYINKHGDIVIEPIFHEANPFDDKGVAVVKNEKSLYGVIDRFGNYVIEPQFESLSPFNEFDFAYVKKKESNSKNLVGLVNRRGQIVIDIEHDSITGFSSDGYAVMDDCCLIDSKGKIIEIAKKDGSNATPATRVQLPGSGVEYFQHGLVWARVGDRYGFINKAGEFVIDCTLKSASDFAYNGLAGVCFEDGTFGYINTKGETVISLAEIENIKSIAAFDANGWARITISPEAYPSLTEKTVITEQINYVNENGKLLLNENESIGRYFGMIYSLEDYILICNRDEMKYTAYDRDGNPAWSIEYKDENQRYLHVFERFIVSGYTAMYDLEGNLIADLSHFGEDNIDFGSFYGYLGDRYLACYAYEANNNNHLYYIFDDTGKFVYGPEISYTAPEMYSDGYFIGSQKPANQNHLTLYKLDENGMLKIAETRGVQAYSTVIEYFQQGRRGVYYYSGYYPWDNYFFPSGDLWSSTIYPRSAQ